MKTFWIVDETWDQNDGIGTNKNFSHAPHLPGEVMIYNPDQHRSVHPGKNDSTSAVWKEEDVFLSGCQLVD